MECMITDRIVEVIFIETVINIIIGVIIPSSIIEFEYSFFCIESLILIIIIHPVEYFVEPSS